MNNSDQMDLVNPTPSIIETREIHVVLCFTEIDQQLGKIKITTEDTYTTIIDRINMILRQNNIPSVTEFYFIAKDSQIIFVNSLTKIDLSEAIKNIVTLYVQFDEDTY